MVNENKYIFFCIFAFLLIIELFVVRRLANSKEKVASLLVPNGFISKKGTLPEPHTKTGWAKEIIHKNTGIEMVFIPAGRFTMGSILTPGKIGFYKGIWYDEDPPHNVSITKPMYMGKYEVTQGQWKKVMGTNPSSFKGIDNLPVESVSFEECQQFLKIAGDGLQLPTEAQWEYDCRSGSKTDYCFGDDVNELKKYAWYRENSKDKTHNVGEKRPNSWGLYDMHGNVAEWCSDWFGKYLNEKQIDPKGPLSGTSKVVRGGAYLRSDIELRSSSRYEMPPDGHLEFVGFRVIKALKQPIDRD